MTRSLIALTLAAALSGCAVNKLSRDIDHDTAASVDQASQLLHDGPKRSADDVMSVHSGIFLGNRATKVDPAKLLPPAFNQLFTLNRQLHSLSEFAERINAVTGIGVQVTPDASNHVAQLLSTSQTGMVGAGGIPVVLPAGGNNPANAQGQIPGQGISLSCTDEEGTLASCLQSQMGRLGLSWQYNDNVIRVYYSDTRTYTLATLPVTSGSQTSIGQSSSGGGNSSGSGSSGSSSSSTTSSDTQLISVTNKSDPLTDVATSIRTILGRDGGDISVLPSNASITVTAPPVLLERVSSFMDATNRNLRKQVRLQVDIYGVSLTDNAQVGINWSVVFNSLSQKYGFNLSTPFNAVTNAGTLNFSILNTATGALGQWGGSQALFDALATQGKVRVVTTATKTTLNNQKIPLRLMTTASYLASTTPGTSTGTGGISLPGLTPGTYTVGFSMGVLPHVLPDNDIQIELDLVLSTLTALKSITSGVGDTQQTIQTPEIESRSFEERGETPSGSTLVFSGFEQNSDSMDRQGLVDPNFWLAGGGQTGARTRTLIVVAVTPVLVDKR